MLKLLLTGRLNLVITLSTEFILIKVVEIQVLLLNHQVHITDKALPEAGALVEEVECTHARVHEPSSPHLTAEGGIGV